MTWVIQLHILFAVPPVQHGKLFSAEKICQELLSIREKGKCGAKYSTELSMVPLSC